MFLNRQNGVTLGNYYLIVSLYICLFKSDSINCIEHAAQHFRDSIWISSMGIYAGLWFSENETLPHLYVYRQSPWWAYNVHCIDYDEFFIWSRFEVEFTCAEFELNSNGVGRGCCRLSGPITVPGAAGNGTGHHPLVHCGLWHSFDFPRRTLQDLPKRYLLYLYFLRIRLVR